MKIGSLFSGYGGLDLGIRLALGDIETVWVSDIEAGPCKILAERFPGVPNLGDVTQVDWTRVEPVDVLCGGFPCQDVSLAGARRGLSEGTRSGLWTEMWKAIRQLRPRMVVIENVPGLLSAHADSDMELCPVCMGDGTGDYMRALGAVLADLAEIGYDAQWTSIRASDIGTPHRRERVFILAYPAGNPWRLINRDSEHTDGGVGDLALLPTPQARDHKGIPGDDFNVASLPRTVSLLPTPMTTDAKIHSPSDVRRHNPGLRALPEILLPTSQAADADFGFPRTSGRPPEMSTYLATRLAYTDFGVYAPAIERWESVLDRSAPRPTQPSKNGKPQLSPFFVEWMMGLPAGWVTGVGLSRAQQLRALGNGVVPQQAETAIRFMVNRAHALEAA